MNFIFISPQFPHTYWNFCDRLHRNGVNVLGIGDSPCYKDQIVMCERMPKIMTASMGNQMYTAHAADLAGTLEFIWYVHQQKKATKI